MYWFPWIAFLVFVALLLLVWKIHHPPPAVAPSADRVYTLRQGETMLLELPGNATTGYTWEVVSQEGTAVEIELPFQYFIPTSPPGMTGQGGFFTTRVIGRQLGSTTLRVVYRQPWAVSSPNPSNIMTIEFRVIG